MIGRRQPRLAPTVDGEPRHGVDLAGSLVALVLGLITTALLLYRR